MTRGMWIGKQKYSIWAYINQIKSNSNSIKTRNLTPHYTPKKNKRKKQYTDATGLPCHEYSCSKAAHNLITLKTQ